MIEIKKYDRYLYLQKNLDGTKIVKRQSPFRATRSFDIITIKNQFIGSGMWLLKKLQNMDNQRNDIAGRVLRNNKAIRNKKLKSNMHSEVADFLTKSVV